MSDAPLFLITPVADDEQGYAMERIRKLVGSGWWVFAKRTPNREKLREGTRLCFYVSGLGVVASAVAASAAEQRPAPGVEFSGNYPWRFRVRDARFFEPPIALDRSRRLRMEAF